MHCFKKDDAISFYLSVSRPQSGIITLNCYTIQQLSHKVIHLNRHRISTSRFMFQRQNFNKGLRISYFFSLRRKENINILITLNIQIAAGQINPLPTSIVMQTI